MYHRWLGRVAIFLALVHGLAYVPDWTSTGDAATVKNLWGFFALMAGLFIFFTATGRMFDDGVIDPRDTRAVLVQALTAIHMAPVEGTTSWGTFRH